MRKRRTKTEWRRSARVVASAPPGFDAESYLNSESYGNDINWWWNHYKYFSDEDLITYVKCPFCDFGGEWREWHSIIDGSEFDNPNQNIIDLRKHWETHPAELRALYES